MAVSPTNQDKRGKLNKWQNGNFATAAESVGWNRLNLTDFEADLGSITDPFGTARFARTTSNPSSGTQSLRLNLKDGAVDPITGKTGDNLQTPNYWPSAALTVSSKTEVARWEGKFRFDACNWPSGNINAKLLYMLSSDPDALANTFYIASNALGGSEGSFNIADNGGTASGWQTRPYGWNYASGNDKITLNLKTGQAFGADATWHDLAIEVDYVNGGAGYSRMRIAIDGIWAQEVNPLDGNVDANGWFNMPPEMVIHGFRLCYADETAALNSTDGTGDNYAAGVQWDDLAVYEGA